MKTCERTGSNRGKLSSTTHESAGTRLDIAPGMAANSSKELASVTNDTSSPSDRLPPIGTPSRCQAVVYHRVGFGRYYRCEKRAKYADAVSCADDPNRTTAYLCGTHHAQLQRRAIDLATGRRSEWPHDETFIAAVRSDEGAA